LRVFLVFLLTKKEKIRNEIMNSMRALENNNLFYFKDKLPAKEHYRLAKYGRIAYVDIETTGLSKYYDKITMIGIYDGKNPKIYVRGDNLEDAREYLKEFDIVVTLMGNALICLLWSINSRKNMILFILI